MGVLSDLEPERVFYYFEEISRIPRASYHEKSISDYLVAFAKEHKLYYIQDDLYNVIMFVPASAGYEQEEPLHNQGLVSLLLLLLELPLYAGRETAPLCLFELYAGR